MKTRHKMIWDKVLGYEVGTIFIDRDCVMRNSANTPGAARLNIIDTGEAEIRKDFLDYAEDLAKKFRNIIVVSAICADASGRVPSRKEQDAVNDLLRGKVEKAGGRIDGFYTEWVDEGEKAEMSPGPLLALLARRDFPSISFSNSLMVGESPADEMMAYNCGMKFLKAIGDPEDVMPTFADDISVEQNIIRAGVGKYVEALNRLINSTPRVNGIRLVSRCCCHAIASGKKILVVCAEDTVMDARQLQRDFDRVTKNYPLTERMRMMSPGDKEELIDFVDKNLDYGDVMIGMAVNGNDDTMIAVMQEAQSRGVVTVSMTGAKPGGMDMSDVVIKVPSTVISHIQGAFRVILSLMTQVVMHEFDSNRTI